MKAHQIFNRAKISEHDPLKDQRWDRFIKNCAFEAYKLDKTKPLDYYIKLFSDRVKEKRCNKINLRKFYKDHEVIDI